MIPHRILLALAQSLLALLLMAGAAQAKPCLFEARDRIGSVEGTLSLSRDVIAPLEDTSLYFQAAPSGGDDDPGSALPGAAPTIVLDHARLIRTSCVSYPNAPPSHRPCAAPPTGPPLV
ncbi:MAG: hypothetical protein ACJ8CF_18140 [Microvirga sp.]|uniref:Uncharacterized protein n=1 Tax=Microvirga tunisiensis TaxID=2108360 RepID=A0A5N7MNC3_9HYPH|nr:hypothetical protein [Microvirga tunisiensis]MPR10201.1 hypothetical protein [Microvirga tunisiensis]MPR28403.1 hypothetical protein [Microvirga tunisiensis]